MIPHLARDFPKLVSTGYRETSPLDHSYNCIAWSAGDTQHVWWPEHFGFWPASAPREVTLDAFIKAFESVGFATCADGSLDPGLEKVALFVSAGLPTHAARQLPNGKWSSKLGQAVDIEHDLVDGVAGPIYGEPRSFMSRAVGQPTQIPRLIQHDPAAIREIRRKKIESREKKKAERKRKKR